MMTFKDFKEIPTNYRRIAVYTIISGLTVVVFSILAVFIFWKLLGSGAQRAEIANKYQAELIIKYGPLFVVSMFLFIKSLIGFKKAQLTQFKTYLVSLVALMAIFIISALAQGFY